MKKIIFSIIFIITVMCSCSISKDNKDTSIPDDAVKITSQTTNNESGEQVSIVSWGMSGKGRLYLEINYKSGSIEGLKLIQNASPTKALVTIDDITKTEVIETEIIEFSGSDDGFTLMYDTANGLNMDFTIYFLEE